MLDKLIWLSRPSTIQNTFLKKESFLWGQLEDFQVDWLGGVAGAGIMPIYVGVIVGFQVLPSLESWCSSLLLFPTQNPGIFG